MTFGFRFAYPSLLLLMAVVLASCSATSPAPKTDYSFSHSPFINPRIIQELSTLISDQGNQVVAVDLANSQNSNRFFAETKVRTVKGHPPYVYVESTGLDKSEFGYQYVGKTTSGIYVVLTSDWGGGSGIFKKLLLLKLERDEVAKVDWTNNIVKLDQGCWLMKKVGEIPLSDRWDGEVKVVEDSIHVSKDRGWFSLGGRTNGTGSRVWKLGN